MRWMLGNLTMISTHSKAACSFSAFLRLTTIAAAGIALSACAQIGGPGQGASLDLGLGQETSTSVADAGGDELSKAVVYWGQKFAREPDNKEAALSYAKNLKAAGQKEQAFQVLQQAAMVHGNDRDLASEYGRLALDMNQVDLAAKLLALADDPQKPDWRVVSARGAALARLGQYGDAVEMFQRANKLAPSNPTVLNNLAMAEAGNGNLKAAETLLRRAAETPMARDKVTSNLALVLNLQGRKAEAEAVAKGGADAIRTSINPVATGVAERTVAQAQ